MYTMRVWNKHRRRKNLFFSLEVEKGQGNRESSNQISYEPQNTRIYPEWVAYLPVSGSYDKFDIYSSKKILHHLHYIQWLVLMINSTYMTHYKSHNFRKFTDFR